MTDPARMDTQGAEEADLYDIDWPEYDDIDLSVEIAAALLLLAGTAVLALFTLAYWREWIA